MTRFLPKRAPQWGALLFFGLGLLPLLASAAEHEFRARVVKVLDGDTVILTDGRHVRLIGINTPELGRDERPAEPLAQAAGELLRQLVEGETIRLRLESDRHDRHGRLLAHLFDDQGRNVQQLLLRRGLAAAIAFPPNLAYLQSYLAAERDARRQGRGIWGHPHFTPVAAGDLIAEPGEFRFIHGTVQRVGKSRKYVYLDLAPRVSLMISHRHWREYFDGRPRDWLGRKLEARGWLSLYNNKLKMRIHHPAMIRRRNEN